MSSHGTRPASARKLSAKAAASSSSSAPAEEPFLGTEQADDQHDADAAPEQKDAVIAALIARVQELELRNKIEAELEEKYRTLYGAPQAQTRSRGSITPPFLLPGDGSFLAWSKTMQALLVDQGLWSIVENGLVHHRIQRSVIGAANSDPNAANRLSDLKSVADGMSEERGVAVTNSSSSSSSSGSASSLAAGADKKREEQAQTAFWLLLQGISKCPEATALVRDVPQGNAQEVWNRLREHYAGALAINKHFLLTEFENLKMKTGESSAMYISRMKQVVMDLEATGMKVDEDLLNQRLINGLESPKYDPAVQYLQFSGQQMNFAALCAYIRSQEIQIMARRKKPFTASAHFAGPSSDAESDSEDRGHARPSFKKKSSSHTSKVKCFNCNELGHFARDCTKKGTGERCTYCAGRSHVVSECQIKKRSETMARENGPTKPKAAQALGVTLASKGVVTVPAEFASVDVTTAAEAATVAEIAGVSLAFQGIVITESPVESPADLVVVSESFGASTVSTSNEPLAGDHCWHVDSGCAHNTAPEDTPLKDAAVNENIRICVASGEILDRPMQGSVKIETPMADRMLELTSVLTHDRMKSRLLSVSQICASPGIAGIYFDKDSARVLTTDDEVLFTAPQVGGVYVLSQCRFVDQCTEGATTIAADAALTQAVPDDEKIITLHNRLGHLGLTGMVRLASVDAVAGLEDVKDLLRPGHVPSIGVCGGCEQGKAHRAPLGTSTPPAHVVAKLPMERANADSFGPLPRAMTGERFLLLISDEASDKTFGYPTKLKSDEAEGIKTWYLQAKTLHGRPLKEFHTDGGGEFRSADLLEFWAGEGVTATITMPHTPQHNARAERKGRTIIEMMRSVLHHAKAPVELWAEAARASVYLRNLLGVKANENRTPNQKWQPEGSPPMKEELKHLRTLFCDAWVHVPKENRAKLDSKSRLCIFIGYEETSLGWRFFDLETGSIVRSRDATFDEKSFKQCDAFRRGLALYGDTARAVDARSYEEYLDEELFQGSMRLGEILSAAEPQPASDAPVQASPPDQVLDAKAPKKSVRFQCESDNGCYESDWDDESVEDGSVYEPSVANSESDSDSDEPRGLSDRVKNKTNFYGMVSLDDVVDVAGYHTMTVPALAAQLDLEGRGRAVESTGQGLADPSTLAEMRQAPDAKKFEASIEDEHKSLIDKAVMVEVGPDELPAGMKPIPTKYVFKRKLNADGLVDRHKTRLVVKGFFQRPGRDFDEDELYAPTLSATSLRLVLAISVQLGYKLKQIDVKTAFLNATLKETVFVTLPKGAKDAVRADGKPRVFRLLKALYGLRQAPKEWNDEFNRTLTVACAFTRSVTDTCIYVRRSKTGRAIIAVVFVDDTVFAHHDADASEVEDIKNVIKSKYEVSDGGECAFLLGMRLTRHGSSLTIDQGSYIERVLEKYGMKNAVPVSTPEEPGVRLITAGSASSTKTGDATSLTELQKKEYMSAVGALLYAAVWTRPDIAHAVGQLTSFISNPKQAHWSACVRVLRYLKGCVNLGLTFRQKKSSAIELGPVFADANWAGDLETRRSTTGIIVKLNDCVVAWHSRRQKSVAMSSTEAEYMALGDATKEVMWLRQMLTELGWTQKCPTKVLGDNNSSLITAHNDTHHGRMKHIDIRHHLIREQVEQKTVQLEWVPTHLQQADILTKALGRLIFNRLRSKLVDGPSADKTNESDTGPREGRGASATSSEL